MSNQCNSLKMDTLNREYPGTLKLAAEKETYSLVETGLPELCADAKLRNLALSA